MMSITLLWISVVTPRWLSASSLAFKSRDAIKQTQENDIVHLIM